MSSRPPTPSARAGNAEIGKQQAPVYVSPLAQHQSMLELSGRSSPQPPRYTSRPESPPTSSPPIDITEDMVGRATVTTSNMDDSRNPYEYASSTSKDREMDIQRERSTLPRIQSNGPNPSSGQRIDSLEATLGSHTLRASSPHPLGGNRNISADSSSTSLDNDQLRSLSLGRHPQVSQHQRSNSIEGHSFKRWGPFSMNRMQSPYIPTTLNTREESNNASPPPAVKTDAGQQASLGLPNLQRESKSASGDVSIESVGSKRKHNQDRMEEQSRKISLDQAMQEQERDELVDRNGETDEEVRNGSSRTVDGVLALPPQRKSCDRCFKMKTKCSRAAPGAAGDEPCDGCIRRGFSNDCITSRPDFPYPRISLFKRARRESSLPALLNLNNNNSAVFVPPSMMQRGNDWRTKLIVNSLHKTGHSSHDRLQDNRSVDSQLFADPINTHRSSQSQHQSHHASANNNKQDSTSLPMASRSTSAANSAAWSSQNSIIEKEAALQSNAGRVANVSHLRSLATPELQDLSRSIAHEVTQRSQTAAPSLAIKTPIVPSVSHPGPLPHQTSQTISRQIVQVTGGASLGQQAMQNTPMQLLPKAVGLPALDYFCQLVFPLFPLSALSPKVLGQRYETYMKPGRNNILELAMSIGLQLQGILLACPDKSQANTAEGRIFKAFLQSGKHGHQANSHVEEKSLHDGSLSIDSIKGWIEPSRHRSRAKDIVKHVMMRRCLKNGLDHDDVLENILLAYFYSIRGDASAYHVFTGNAQRQLALLEIHQVTREDPLWSASDIKTVQDKVVSMERLHPIKYFTRSASHLANSTIARGDEEKQDFVTLQKKLSDIANFVQSSSKSSANLDVEVDERLASFQQSLPPQLQVLVRSEWMSNDHHQSENGNGNGDWISDMIRGASTTPCLRVNICVNVCYIRLLARQSFLIQALRAIAIPSDDSIILDSIQQIRHISSSILSSTSLACTVFPQVVSFASTFAAELCASAWCYLLGEVLLLQSSSPSQIDRQKAWAKMQETLGQLIDILTSSQEKETWPFVSSLQTVKSIIIGIKDCGDAKKWLTIFSEYYKLYADKFARMLSGDTWAAEDFRKLRTSQT